MRTNCVPFLADLFLYSYENEFLDKFIEEAKESLPGCSVYYIVRLMSLSLSIIKDSRSSFLIFTPKNSQFSKLQNCFLSRSFYPRSKQQHNHQLDNKHDAFGFHIVNFPLMSSNIPSAPAYGVYASQLIRYARCCSNYSHVTGSSDKTSVAELHS